MCPSSGPWPLDCVACAGSTSIVGEGGQSVRTSSYHLLGTTATLPETCGNAKRLSDRTKTATLEEGDVRMQDCQAHRVHEYRLIKATGVKVDYEDDGLQHSCIAHRHVDGACLSHECIALLDMLDPGTSLRRILSPFQIYSPAEALCVYHACITKSTAGSCTRSTRSTSDEASRRGRRKSDLHASCMQIRLMRQICLTVQLLPRLRPLVSAQSCNLRHA